MSLTEEEIIQTMTEQKYSPAELAQEITMCANSDNCHQQQLLQLLCVKMREEIKYDEIP